MIELIKNLALSLVSETTKRDWGQSIILRTEERDDGATFYREKFLIFNPGASIVLESHEGYDEVWMPDSPLTYLLETDRMGGIERRSAQRHERVVIPRGKKHKIINHTDHELCMFEIQVGIVNPEDKKQYKNEDSTYDKLG